MWRHTVVTVRVRTETDECNRRDTRPRPCNSGAAIRRAPRWSRVLQRPARLPRAAGQPVRTTDTGRTVRCDVLFGLRDRRHHSSSGSSVRPSAALRHPREDPGPARCDRSDANGRRSRRRGPRLPGRGREHERNGERFCAKADEECGHFYCSVIRMEHGVAIRRRSRRRPDGRNTKAPNGRRA